MKVCYDGEKHAAENKIGTTGSFCPQAVHSVQYVVNFKYMDLNGMPGAL